MIGIDMLAPTTQQLTDNKGLIQYNITNKLVKSICCIIHFIE